MISKGIILAGGTGRRLSPITNAVNKHLLPISDKPMIYYPLSILMLSKIRNILIVINKNEKKLFEAILGPVKDLGIKISYQVQLQPNGIGDVFKICKKFIYKSPFCLVLGDNFFYGQALSDYLDKIQEHKNGVTIFTYPVKNTSEFGILEKRSSQTYKLVEKPKKTKSNKAVTGLYVFDDISLNHCSKLMKSNRNELEIEAVINSYIKEKKIKVINLGRGAAWFDMGTFSNFLNVNSLVSIIEERQKFKIACLEEIAFKNGWINKVNVQNRIKFYGNSNLADYLKDLV